MAVVLVARPAMPEEEWVEQNAPGEPGSWGAPYMPGPVLSPDGLGPGGSSPINYDPGEAEETPQLAYVYHDGFTDVFYSKGDATQHLRYCRSYESGLLKWVKGPGFTETLAHDDRGNVLAGKVQADGSDAYTLARMGYDAWNNLVQRGFGYKCQPEKVWQYEWDEEYQVPVRVTDPEGFEIRVEYENALPVKIRRMRDETNSFDVLLSYAEGGLLTNIVNANGHAVRIAYEERGYFTNVLFDTGFTIGITRDSFGYPDLVHFTGQVGPRTYDLDVNEEGLLERMAYPDGRSVSLAYDEFGNVTNYTDAAGRTTTVSYLLGRPTKINRILEGTPDVEVSIEFSYDQQMESVSVKDPTGRYVEWYELDGQDRIVTVTNEENQTLHFDYAVAGFVTNMLRFDGTEVAVQYDAQGYVSEIRYPTLQNRYTFLGNGILQQAENEAGVISNAYGAARRLMSVLQPVPNGSVTYTRYPAGQVSNMVYAGIMQSRAYDAMGNLMQLSEPQGVIGMTYSATNNRMSNVSYPSGMHAEYTYDVTDRKTGIVWRDGANNILRSLSYAYDAADMITNVVHASGARTAYVYDSLDRLLREEYFGPTGQLVRVLAYEYDLAGNRLSKTDNGQAEYYTVGIGNKVSAWGNGSYYLYDNAGNVTRRYYNSTNDLDMEWNDRYQMSELYKNGLLAEAYTYDALGRRISVSDGQDVTFFIYDGRHIAAEVDSDGTLRKSYTYGPGMDNVLSMTVYSGGGSQTYYYLKDQLNTVLALTDANGAIAESYEYDAWGNVRVFDAYGAELIRSAIGNRYTFQGREFSWTTGLYYFRARWYDPVTGRWLSKDPIGISGGLNLYAFCGNNPVNFIDPFGHCSGTPEGFLEIYFFTKHMGKQYGWPYAHVLANALITQQYGKTAAKIASVLKEGGDLVKSPFSEDSARSFNQAQDWEMNEVGQNIPPGADPFDYSEEYKGTPEGEPGPLGR